MNADVPWRERAACRPGTGVDADLFWPDQGDPGALALHICRAHCAVRQECDEWVTGEGVRGWGGSVIGGRRFVSLSGGRVQESVTASPAAAGCPACDRDDRPTSGLMPCPQGCGRVVEVVSGQVPRHYPPGGKSRVGVLKCAGSGEWV